MRPVSSMTGSTEICELRCSMTLQCVEGPDGRRHGDGVGVHEVGAVSAVELRGRSVRCTARRRSPSVTIPTRAAAVVDDADRAEGEAAQLRHDVEQRGVGPGRAVSVTAVHEVADRSSQPPAEPARRVVAGEALGW